jgi:hypothetical protein
MMSRSGQAPRNGLAKLLWDAGEDDDPQQIATERERYHCPNCGWEAQLHRQACMSCSRDRPLEPVSREGA